MSQFWAQNICLEHNKHHQLLDIIANNQHVQYQMNRTGQAKDIAQTPVFGPNLGLNEPILGPKIVVRRKYLHQQLEIIASNQNVQNQKNRPSQTQDIGRKPVFGPNLGLNGPILGPNIFFKHNEHQQLLDIIVIYHNLQNCENLMI